MLLKNAMMISPGIKYLFQKIGISPEKVAFFLSNRAGRRGVRYAGTVRRGSDSKTTVIPYRPNVAYDAHRNMLHYNPETWAEAALIGATADASGVTIDFTQATSSASIVTNFKPLTKYGILCNVISNTASRELFLRPTSDVTVSGWISAGVTGSLKTVVTTLATITTNTFRFANGGIGTGAAKIRDIRVLELPAGSQIEADFTNAVTQEQINALSAKYPMCCANGAPCGSPAGRQRDRVVNQFENGDGRFGLIGVLGAGGILSSIKGGARVVGGGANTFEYVYAKNGGSVFKNSATKRYYIRALVSSDPSAQYATFVTYNGTTYQTVSYEKGSNKWVHAILTQTDLGSSGGLQIRAGQTFVDNATQNGKVFEIKYWSIVEMGDLGDPGYDRTLEEMDTWGLSQVGKGAIAVEGSWYLLPYGTMPGEEDLDIKATFGGTSALYLTDIKCQGLHNINLEQLVPNGDFHLGVASWSGYNSVLSVTSGEVVATGNGSGNYVGVLSTNATSKNAVNGRVYHCRAKVRVDDASALDLRVFFQSGSGALQTNGAIATAVNGSYVMVSGNFTANADGAVTVYASARYADNSTANGKAVKVDGIRIYDLTNDFGRGVEPTAAEMTTIMSAQTVTYWEGVRQVDCSSAFNAYQPTAIKQPKIWDNGVDYSGLGFYLGSNFVLQADLPNITHPPVLFWAIANNQEDGTGYLFAKNLSTSDDIQYGINASSSGGLTLYLEGLGRATIAAPKYKDVLVMFLWAVDPVDSLAKIWPILVNNGVETVGAPVSFTGPLTTRPNGFIGCRSNAVDGYTQTVLLSGEIREIGIVTDFVASEQRKKIKTV